MPRLDCIGPKRGLPPADGLDDGLGRAALPVQHAAALAGLEAQGLGEVLELLALQDNGLPEGFGGRIEGVQFAHEVSLRGRRAG